MKRSVCLIRTCFSCIGIILFLSVYSHSFAASPINDNLISLLKDKPTFIHYLRNFQISGALGISQLNINHGAYKFIIDPSDVNNENDNITSNKASYRLHTKIGIGYNLFADKLIENKILHSTIKFLT